MQVVVRDYPQLQGLCWNRVGDVALDGEEALMLYERNWRFVDVDALTGAERRLIDELVKRYGGGVMLV